MFDWDVVIIGGGPAGLTAGLYLSRGRIRTLLLEHETIGGKIKNLESIENYSGYSNGIQGAKLANEMQNQATRFGLHIENARVTGMEIYSGSKCVVCENGKSYTCSGIILASGSRPKKLGVPGEDSLNGRGVFYCAYCDGGQFENLVVVVCGAGDAGLTEALYMARIASRVIVLEAFPQPTASAIILERALTQPNLEIRCGTKITRILGEDRVGDVECMELSSNKTSLLKVDGVLVHIGLDPNVEFIPSTIPLDKQRQVLVNERMETKVPVVAAAGDVRTGSPGQLATAVGDGATAAISIMRQLQSLK